MAQKETNHQSMTAQVVNTEGKDVGTIELPAAIFGIEVNDSLISQSVRVFLANKRQGTRSTKTRTMVTGSTKKIYKQKGTGRARHGDIKAPIFVGGGIAHGPKPQDFSLEMPKMMRRKALFSALSGKLQSGQIKIVDGVSSLEAKTKQMMTMLTKLEVAGKKAMLVIPDYSKALYLAGRNIQSLTVTEARLLHTYDVMTHTTIVLAKDAVKTLEQVFLSKEKESASKTTVEAVIAKKDVEVKKTAVKKEVKKTSAVKPVKKVEKKAETKKVVKKSVKK